MATGKCLAYQEDSFISLRSKMHADKKILVAFDGSDAAIRAIEKIAELLGSQREVVIFTVWEANLIAPHAITSGLTLTSNREIISQVIHAAQDHAQQVADCGVEIANQCGLKASSRISSNAKSVKASIINAITQHDICLLVVGSHQHGALSSIFLGSTTQALLQEVVLPVLVVRPIER